MREMLAGEEVYVRTVADVLLGPLAVLGWDRFGDLEVRDSAGVFAVSAGSIVRVTDSLGGEVSLPAREV